LFLLGANALGKGLICPASCGAEAAWAAEDMSILAPSDLLVLVNHFKGLQTLRRPQPTPDLGDAAMPDLRDIKGQETAKRALEVAAAGGHNLLMIGPPGAGKSMLARRLPSLLPPLEPAEMLEVSMIRSLAGDLNGGRSGARGHSAARIIPRAWRRSSAAARGRGPERWRLRISACCFSMSGPLG